MSRRLRGTRECDVCGRFLTARSSIQRGRCGPCHHADKVSRRRGAMFNP